MDLQCLWGNPALRNIEEIEIVDALSRDAK